MSIDVPFTKESLEGYLKELAKEYKKRGRGIPAAILHRVKLTGNIPSIHSRASGKACSAFCIPKRG